MLRAITGCWIRSRRSDGFIKISKRSAEIRIALPSSAGSIDAGLLLSSPLAVGLFQRVILESGPVLSLAHHPDPLEKGERFGEAVARSLGPPGNLRKLRDSTPERIVEVAREAARGGRDPGFVLDGWCVRESPAKTFAESRQMPVDMMIGNNGREISVFRDAAASSDGNSGLRGDASKETIRIFYGASASIVGGLYVVDSALHRTEAADAWINDVDCTSPEMAMALLQADTGHRIHLLVSAFHPGKRAKEIGLVS